MSSRYPLRNPIGNTFNSDDFDEEKNRKHSNYLSIKKIENNSNEQTQTLDNIDNLISSNYEKLCKILDENDKISKLLNERLNIIEKTLIENNIILKSQCESMVGDKESLFAIEYKLSNH
jgi:DNA-binding transcriptional regulator GbsR (MarR family)